MDSWTIEPTDEGETLLKYVATYIHTNQVYIIYTYIFTHIYLYAHTLYFHVYDCLCPQVSMRYHIYLLYHVCMTSLSVIPFHLSVPSPPNRLRNGHQKQSPAEPKLERRFWVDCLHDLMTRNAVICVGCFLFF